MNFTGKCVHYLSLAQTPFAWRSHRRPERTHFPNQIVKILLQLVGDSAYNYNNVCECLWIRDVCEVGGNDGLESFNDGNNKLMKVLIVCDEWKIQHTTLLLSLPFIIASIHHLTHIQFLDAPGKSLLFLFSLSSTRLNE